MAVHVEEQRYTSYHYLCCASMGQLVHSCKQEVVGLDESLPEANLPSSSLLLLPSSYSQTCDYLVACDIYPEEDACVIDEDIQPSIFLLHSVPCLLNAFLVVNVQY